MTRGLLAGRVERAVFALGLAVVIGAVVVGRVASSLTVVRIADNVHWTTGYATGALLAWLGWRRGEPAVRASRLAFAVGLTAYTLGQVSWDIQVATGWNPFPGPSDAFFLLLGPCCWFGLRASLGALPPGRSRRGLALDSLVLTAAVITLTLALYLPRRGETPAWPLAVMAAYPVFLLSAAAAGLIAVLYVRPRPSPPWLIVVVAQLANGALWMVWNVLTLDGELQDGTLYNACFSFAAIALGAGAGAFRLDPSADPRARRWGEWGARQLPMVAVVVAAVAVVLGFALDQVPYAVRLANVGGGLVVALLALIRQSMLVDELDTAHERAQAALAEQARLIEELQQKNTEMEQFTYTVSHDLKSPVVTIHGFIGAIEQDLDAGRLDAVRSDLMRVRTAGARMTRLLDDLLALSRVGRIGNPRAEVALTAVVAEAREQVAGRLAERRIEVEVMPDLPVVSADRTRLVQVFQNLLDNAAKYMGNQPAPTVSIAARVDGDEVICTVTDNGMGIDPRFADKVFGLFEKLDPRAEGTGIGLALVKRIIEFHGGRVWVESAGLGHGSTFGFSLPRRVRSPGPSGVSAPRRG